MKILIIVATLLFVSCYSRIENAGVTDCGKKEIGNGLYLKKIVVGGDRIYMLVDENDKLITGSTASSYTVQTDNSSHTESNGLINP